MKFTLARNLTISTSSGHAVEFKKGVPTYVPPDARSEVMQRGAVPEEDIPEDEVSGTDVPADPAERVKAVFAAFDIIVKRNRREDFGAGGAPNGKVVNDELKWPLASKDRATFWQEYKVAKGQPE